jgi:hypothetical protein
LSTSEAATVLFGLHVNDQIVKVGAARMLPGSGLKDRLGRLARATKCGDIRVSRIESR